MSAHCLNKDFIIKYITDKKITNLVIGLSKKTPIGFLEGFVT